MAGLRKAFALSAQVLWRMKKFQLIGGGKRTAPVSRWAGCAPAPPKEFEYRTWHLASAIPLACAKPLLLNDSKQRLCAGVVPGF